MRKAFWHFGFIGGVVSLLATSAVASTPTFSLRLGGINGEIFREIPCATDAQCPDGSSCVLTEVTFPGNFELRCSPISEVRLKCVGGTTPGIECTANGDCGGLSAVCAGLVVPGDELAVEAYLSGWDQDADLGVCNNGDSCIIAQNNCEQRHCSLGGQLCITDRNCQDGETCVEDDCATGPLLGAYQWTVDCDSYESMTNQDAVAFEPMLFSCAVDEDCRHGYSFESQCTCARAKCDLAGFCTPPATAYFELINFLYVYRDFSHEKLISTNTCNYNYAGAASRGGKEDELEQKYAGTLRLFVPDDAMGTYMLDFDSNINFTFANDASAHRFPAPVLNQLVIELPDPCAGFDCQPPPNACSEFVCRIVDGAPECVRQPVVCQPGDKCIGPEGGCVPSRACCDTVLETCSLKSNLQCDNASGAWLPDEPACDEGLCVGDFGACCAGDGGCTMELRDDCDSAGGVFQGIGVSCGDVTCPPPGACCADDGGCSMETQTDCDSAGSVFQGDGVLCGDVTCPLPGACCVAEVCSQTVESDCAGTFKGEGVVCDAEICVPPPGATLLSSTPPHDGSLWRSKKNITRLTFDGDLSAAPATGEIEIFELLPDCVAGPNLSASFDMSVEGGNVLRIQDTGETLVHRKWYGIRNAGGWSSAADFMVHYLVQMGDCDGNKIVISLDVGCVNAGIPCFINCGDDNRKDIDGDGRIISLDVGVVNGHIGSFGVQKPSGW